MIMSVQNYGVLIPVGGGDAIPLIRNTLTLGRRESCDICLRFPNVSGVHCELTYKDGYWTVRDLNSTNGIKVNGVRVQKKGLRPGDVITIAKRSFTIEYNLTIGKQALSEMLEDSDEVVMDLPLLQKAGLEKPEDERQVKSRKSRPLWGEEETDE
jgi:adenylate cyclase